MSFTTNSLPVAALAISLILAGCSAIRPAGLLEANRIEPLKTDPSAFAVAVAVPDTVQLSDGDVLFRISFRQNPDSPKPEIDESVPLTLRLGSDGAPSPNAADEVVYVARFSPEAAQRVADAQSEIRTLRAQGIEGAGAITVTLVGGCYTQASLETLPFSTWLKTDPSRDFVQMTRRIDALKAADAETAALLRESLKPCRDAV